MVMLGAVQMFEAVGFGALVAFSAEEAIAHLEGRSGISVMFAECELPGEMDGPSLAQQVRNRWPTIEIIMVSSRFQMDIKDLPLGARFFEKPYTHAEIEQALHDLGILGAAPRARSNQPPR